MKMVGGPVGTFACTNEGCGMTFPNEDNLNIHKKTHEMILNLGFKNGNVVTDQTPTPTSFLQNCEEVGLFQDLQNVNPFEETFKKAVEMVKTGSLSIPDLPEDDTLHTPHVFPHIPSENTCMFNVPALKNVETPVGKVPEIEISSDTLQSANPIIIVGKSVKTFDKLPVTTGETKAIDSQIDSKVTKKSVTKYRKYVNIKPDIGNNSSKYAKMKLQQILQSKQIKTAEAPNIVSQPIFVLQNLKIANSSNCEPANSEMTSTTPILLNAEKKLSELPKEKNKEICKKKLDLLERNRVAAIRCRQRKKMWIGTLESKYEALCKEKEEMQKEIDSLKNQNMHLRSLLFAHKDCSVTRAMNMGQSIPIETEKVVTIQIPEISKDPNPSNIFNSAINVSNVKIIKSNAQVITKKISFVNETKNSVIVLNDFSYH